MDHQTKVAMQKIVDSLHLAHEILDNILHRASEEKEERISEWLNLDPKDGLRFLELEARSIHDLVKEVEVRLSRVHGEGKDGEKQDGEYDIKLNEGIHFFYAVPFIC